MSEGEFVTAKLPKRGDFECDEVIRPELCEWANSVDAVVVGKVRELRPLQSPVWVHAGESSALADQCEDGWTQIGLVLVLEVSAALFGGDVPGQVEIHVGPEGMAAWSSRPVLEEGALGWSNSSSPTFQVGTTIGLGISHLPEREVWALMGEFPFTFTSEGVVVTPDGYDCAFNLPAEMPVDFASLESSLASCAPADVPMYDLRQIEFTQRPDFAYAAACHPRE